MSATESKRVEWEIGFDEPDQTFFIAINKGGALIRLNGNYLTRESAVLDIRFLRKEYDAAHGVARKEESLFN